MIAGVEEAVRSALPSTWRVDRVREPGNDVGSRAGRADAVLTLTAPDGSTASVVVECKGVVVPRDVARIAARTAARRAEVGDAVIVAAPFVSPTTQAQLDRHGLGWFDVTGNLRLRLDRPAVFLDRAGATRSGFRDPAEWRLKSLRGPAAARVVLALCELDAPVGVRDLAARARVGVATSSRVLDLLAREATIDRADDGPVVAVRKALLVRRWALDHDVMTANEVITAIDPRGVAHAVDRLPTIGSRVTVTGSAAARRLLPDGVTPVAPLTTLAVYADDPLDAIAELGVRRVDRGANVLVLRPYDDVVHTTARRADGVAWAAAGQTVVDLLTGPGRASEEAEQVLTALAVTDEAWAS